MHDVHTNGRGEVKIYSAFEDKQYRADGVDGPQQMEIN